MTFSELSVGSDDSASSDLTSYYCLDCDVRHELGTDAEPFICDSNYFTANDDIHGMHDIVRAPAAMLARYQIYAIDPATGNKIPEGRRDPEASSSHVTVSQAEWDAAQYAIVNNTRLPIGASPGTLSAYHSILEKNRVRLQRAEPNSRKEKQLLTHPENAGETSHLAAATVPEASTLGTPTDREFRVSQRGTWPASRRTCRAPS